MNHLFLFSISPVQSYIGQARKAQDLYAGSRILSKLAREAAEEAERQGIKLVFPQLNTELLSFPNRFTGILNDNSSQEELHAKGKAVEEKAKAVFRKEAEKVLKEADYEKNTPEGFWPQIENHLDTNWLFVPYDHNGVDYKTAFARADALLTAVKNTRFISNPAPKAGRKCSLDGERNALFRGPGTTNSILTFQTVEIDGRTTGVWLAPNEGLSAVSMMKRAYKEGKNRLDAGFPSTAEVALSHQIRALSEKNKTILEYYRQLYSESFTRALNGLQAEGIINQVNLDRNDIAKWRFNFDEQLLYEENLTDKNIPSPTQIKAAKTIQQQLKPHLTHKYYALLSFDADRMGKLLSGELLRKKDADLPGFQGKVSNLLLEYSQYIYQNHDQKDIHVVYAGGDDFLGFVNLKYLFKAFTALRTKFKEIVSGPLQNEVARPITFSAGIVIAHYKTPLHIVLQSARAMQKLAKDEDQGDRDAIAIKVLKHSGEGHKTYFKWEDGSKWEALCQLSQSLLEGCSDTFIRSLEREFLPLQNQEGTIINGEASLKYDEMEESGGVLQTTRKKQDVTMLQTELLRLAARSLPEGHKDKAAKLRDAVWRLFDTERKILHEEVALQNALEALKTAIFIHRQTKEKNK